MRDLSERRIAWSPELKAVYQKHPSVIRSKDWPEIVRLANGGDKAGAMELAQKAEKRNPRLRVENVIARRMRIERVQLFTRIARAEKELKDLFNEIGDDLASKIERKASGPSSVKHIYAAIHTATTALGSGLRGLMRALVRDSATLGLKNAGDAFLPVFKDHWESILQEDKLSFGFDPAFANRNDPRVSRGSAKWRSVVSKIVYNQAKSNKQGVSFSDSVWNLKGDAERQLRQLIANGVANGESPDVIARKAKKYLSPEASGKMGEDVLPRGVYGSAFRNAWRLARTEAGKAYTQASAEFARGKKWIKGVRVTISAQSGKHVEDICDDYVARGVLTPDEFQELIPAHPHCMCYPTYVVDEDVLDLAGEKAA